MCPLKLIFILKILYQNVPSWMSGWVRKEKESILKRYAKKLGLNDRGCYLAIGLAIITFFLLVIIVAMAISWPGEMSL